MDISIRNDEKWLEEIIRETEHYYQGEMQQEERSSWLLGTASALLAIIISVFISCVENNVHISNFYFVIPLGAFFVSAVIAIWGLVPYRGTNGFRILALREKVTTDAEKLLIDEFIRQQFRPDDVWSEESCRTRVFYHFRSHYIRNYQKSQRVVWSAILLLLGLFSSLFIVWGMITG